MLMITPSIPASSTLAWTCSAMKSAPPASMRCLVSGLAFSSSNAVSKTLVSSVERSRPAGLVAPFGQRVELAGQLVQAGHDIDVVGVTSGDGEGLLLTAAADKDRNAIAVARFGQRRLGGVPLAR